MSILLITKRCHSIFKYSANIGDDQMKDMVSMLVPDELYVDRCLEIAWVKVSNHMFEIHVFACFTSYVF